MRVCVIVPTLNPSLLELSLLVSRVKANREHDVRVLCIDSGSRESEIIKCFADEFISISPNEFDHGGTRNKAALLAQDAEILIFMTQDAVPIDESMVARLIEPLGDDVVAAYARQLPKRDAKHLEAITRLTNYPPVSQIKNMDSLKLLGVKNFFFSNVCSAVDRDQFFSLGGFPEHIIMNEDMAFAANAIRNGKSIQYAANAEVYHSHNYSLLQQFRRNFDVGVFFRDYARQVEAGKVGTAGARFVLDQVSALAKDGRWSIIPEAVLEAGVKFLGFQFGQRYSLFPVKVRKKMSMHSFYWQGRK
ncbi:rhamnosyltransferase [Deinococcus hopiensis KR-140]|uniref:Rhamnosyltransferase n=2 Tax=Deinococcus TaxID=1298 RepID=A0A1W1VAF1_9DEIO|nr:rhamnosyltransferase [Deinococcus hopiensis KR-140]